MALGVICKGSSVRALAQHCLVHTITCKRSEVIDKDTEAQSRCTGSHSLEMIPSGFEPRSDPQVLVFPLHILPSVHVEAEGQG